MRKSFTLIELMLVVIIIGILASLVAPRLAGRAEKAKRKVAKAAVEATLPAALDLYEMDVGQYPSKLEDLLASPSGASSWDGPYLKKMPLDPWGKPYDYKLQGGHAKDYDLSSSGRDGILGNEDDINNWE